jgi:competence ComEA-like helix-hairpin-helix protein
MNNSFREWFVFTRKERTGVIVLMFLILAATCLPWFFSANFEKPDTKLTKEIAEKLLAVHNSIDSSVITLSDRDEDRSMLHYDKPALKPATLFEFDPNTLSAAGWRKLGLRERAIRVIQKYLSRGGKFRQPADLKKIYGLPEEMAARLLPYVRIHMPEKNLREDFPKYKKREPSVVDINTADTAALIALPGIGSKLARRIITFRDKLGGFHAVEQVKETYGLPDSTFQQINPLLKIGAGTIRTIDINSADEEALSNHPYITRNLANAIVRYRQQHGPYKSVEDLKNIVLVTTEIFQKIVLYLAVE